MGMLIHVYTTPHHLNLHLLRIDRKNSLLTNFIAFIDADSKYLSIGFDFVQFD